MSAGAINASAFALFPKGEEKQASEWIDQIWARLKSDDIYDTFLGGEIAALWHSSMYDTEPGRETLKRLIQESGKVGFSRRLAINAVDANTGEIFTMTEASVPFMDFQEAILASSAVPALFPPIQLQGHLLIDGGTAHNVNIEEAIQRCMEIVDDESKITIDIIICNPESIQVIPKEDRNTWENFKRSMSIKDFYRQTRLINRVKSAHPTINWRFEIRQSKQLTGLDKISFTPEVTLPVHNTGVKDARKHIQEYVAKEYEAMGYKREMER